MLVVVMMCIDEVGKGRFLPLSVAGAFDDQLEGGGLQAVESGLGQ